MCRDRLQRPTEVLLRLLLRLPACVVCPHLISVHYFRVYLLYLSLSLSSSLKVLPEMRRRPEIPSGAVPLPGGPHAAGEQLAVPGADEATSHAQV